MTNDLLPLFVLVAVMVCWFVFTIAFLFRKKLPGTKEQKREKSFVAGIALQGIAYALVWTFRRPLLSTIFPMSFLVELALGMATIGIAILSVWLVIASVRILGKQWALAARLVEGHTLITEGPYKIVRHPIYTGMFGMMIATGLALSYWQALILAVIVFWIGTALRARSEDKLLRSQFLNEFDEYAARTPALFPKLF